MIEYAPLILLGLLLGGVALTWYGRRGRRVNDHPVCRRCRFDLHGVYPGGRTCPECGGKLSDGAIRIGVRARRRVPYLTGIALLLISGLMLGTAGWLMGAGPTLNKYKPVALLTLEGRYGNAKSSREAAKELVKRMSNDELGRGDINLAVNAALSIQGAMHRPWIAEWGDVIEAVHGAGKLDSDKFMKYVRQSVVLECRVRPEVVSGDSLPLVVGVGEWRRAAGSAFELGAWVEKVKIGGKEVEWGYHGERRFAMRNSSGPLRIASSAKTVWTSNAPGADTLGLEFDLPEGLSAGVCDVELDVRISDEAGSAAASTPVAKVVHVVKRPFRVAERVDHTDAGTPQVSEALRDLLSRTKVELSVVTWGGDANEPTWRACVTVPRADSPSPFIFDVWIVIEGNAYMAGTVMSGQLPRRARLGVNMGGVVVDPEKEVMFVVELPTEEAPGDNVKVCRVEFRPRPDLAALTLDMTRVIEEDVVVDGVPLERVVHRPATMIRELPRFAP